MTYCMYVLYYPLHLVLYGGRIIHSPVVTISCEVDSRLSHLVSFMVFVKTNNTIDNMAPREESSLLNDGSKTFSIRQYSSFDEAPRKSRLVWASLLTAICLVGVTTWVSHNHKSYLKQPIGPYQLVECQEGETFFDHYTFFDGPDSLGSAGYNVYVSEKRATELGVISVTEDGHVIMKSAPTVKGPRESVRLEGKRRYDRGLFILDLTHMPAGAGVWPAFWLTDESEWPKNGEIDIVEGINNQTRAKTALHTSEQCSMFAHVPEYVKTGTWDRATGLPDTFTGKLNFNTSKEADDCWNMAAHQWGNQGCVLIDDQEGTIGEPVNEKGGGVYALEWDPANRYIKSWSFSRDTLPTNLRKSMDTASQKNNRVIPDPDQWGLPYAYFAVGEGTGCSADHFKNMHIVFNLAFCGNVAGNRFFRDCAEETKLFNVKDDPILSCNAWIQSNPKALEEAYWKIRGVYVYEREMQAPHPATNATGMN